MSSRWLSMFAATGLLALACGSDGGVEGDDDDGLAGSAGTLAGSTAMGGKAGGAAGGSGGATSGRGGSAGSSGAGARAGATSTGGTGGVTASAGSSGSGEAGSAPGGRAGAGGFAGGSSAGTGGTAGQLAGAGGTTAGSSGVGSGGAGSGSAGTGGKGSAGSGGAGGGDPSGCPADGNVTYTLTQASNPTADQLEAYELITEAMDKALEYYNCYTNITKAVTVQYNPSVQTADGNSNGSIRFGGKQYMEYSRAMHEIAHTVGIGTYQEFHDLTVDGIFTGAAATAQVRENTGDPEEVVHADSQHFWPGGLNYASEAGSEKDVIDHCLMVVAIRKDMGFED